MNQNQQLAEGNSSIVPCNHCKTGVIPSWTDSEKCSGCKGTDRYEDKGHQLEA